MTSVNQIKHPRYNLSEDEVVAKMLRSLVPKFGVTAIKESRDITKMFQVKLSGSLQAYEGSTI